MSRTSRVDEPAPERDPLAPLDTLVSLFFAVIVAFGLFGVATTIPHLFGKHGSSVLSFSDHVCVDSRSFTTSGDDSTIQHFAEPGSSVHSAGTMFCTSDPAWGLQWAASTGPLLALITTLTACILARRIIKIARRDGLFIGQVSKLLRALGWFLIITSVLVPVASAIGDGIFLAAAATSETGLTWTSGISLNPDFAALVLGVCAITFGRVVRRGIALQEDVAFTI